MAGAQVAEREKGKAKSGRRKKRRLNIRIDMTPMVDIVMLLLIFYMVTTVFAMPQAMEINLPPDKEDVEVPESRLLSIRIDAENQFFWNIGNPADSLPRLIPSIESASDTGGYRVDSDSLRMLLVNLNRQIERLNTIIIINPDAQYNSMVDILDEIDLLERSWNAALAREEGVEVDELPEKFSYRYAIGKWEDRDGKIVEAALQAALGGGE